ncbi:APC family permease [Burkholderia singularis]|uniref:APC family permease n=1 Tax=Burkholderia singularis TaxID=1503053 RepID=UPI000B78AE07|nr:amino acid permease [Burkholderia singularis]
MTTLRRQISLSSGIALAVGMVIGSGLFGLPGLALQISSPQTAAWGWLICTLACVPLIWIFAVLGARFASAAGISRYVEAALGQRAEYGVTAVLCGTFPLSVPALAMIGGSYALTAFGIEPERLLVVSALFLLSAVLFNLSGVRTTTLINKVSLLLIVATVLILAALRLPDLITGGRLWTAPDFTAIHPASLWKVTVLIFWAYLGWENMSFGLEEFKNPNKTIKQVYFLSFVTVVVLYFALAATMNGASIHDSNVNVTQGIAHLVPAQWRQLFSIATLVIILANANAWVFGASRLFYSAGRNGLLPDIFGKLDRRGIPRNALLLLAGCFAAVLLASAIFHLKIEDLVLIANQNFLVLYVACLYCFWKIETGPSRWPLMVLGSASCAFLLAGFSYRMLYPIALLIAGMLYQQYRAKRPGLSV